VPVTFTLGTIQLAACVVMPFAAVALAYLVGIAEGRAREACEATQKLADDDGSGLGVTVRRRH
jgi:hypothetical protein